MDIKGIMKKYHEQSYIQKTDNLDYMAKYLKDTNCQNSLKK